MCGPCKRPALLAAAFSFCLFVLAARAQNAPSQIGREVAIPRHLQDGEVYQLPISQLIAFGERLFTARWTVQEGAGRPLSKANANGARLSDPFSPLTFPFNFNRLSGPDANSCSFMHHGKFTTMREAVLAHSGEALASRHAFVSLSPYEWDRTIEFLKPLQILSPQTRSLIGRLAFSSIRSDT